MHGFSLAPETWCKSFWCEVWDRALISFPAGLSSCPPTFPHKFKMFTCAYAYMRICSKGFSMFLEWNEDTWLFGWNKNCNPCIDFFHSLHVSSTFCRPLALFHGHFDFTILIISASYFILMSSSSASPTPSLLLQNPYVTSAYLVLQMDLKITFSGFKQKITWGWQLWIYSIFRLIWRVIFVTLFFPPRVISLHLLESCFMTLSKILQYIFMIFKKFSC